MGTDIVTQCHQMTGITVAAIAEINIDSAKKALRIAGRPEDFRAYQARESAKWGALIRARNIRVG